MGFRPGDIPIVAPATDAARKWAGFGTSLKPAYEPIIMARKPIEGTVAANVLKWGTGGINIDGCRVGTDESLMGGQYSGKKRDAGNCYGAHRNLPVEKYQQPVGRWPSNFIHDGSEEVLELFPDVNGPWGKGKSKTDHGEAMFNFGPDHKLDNSQWQGSGSAARFFYCAKASRAEREAGCEGMEADGLIKFSQGKAGKCPLHGVSNPSGLNTYACGCPIQYSGEKESLPAKNSHPTVKPLALMRYLCRLVTPPDGIILDPFTGSGTTGMAAKQEGFEFIGIEKEQEYVNIAERRIEATA